MVVCSVQIQILTTLFTIALTDKDKADKTFSFAFFKVMRSDGSIISDGQHKLYVYKVSMTMIVMHQIKDFQSFYLLFSM